MINPKSERKQYWSFVKMDTATYQCTELQMLADASRDACLLFYMFVQRFANTEGCLAFQDGSVLVGMNEKQICAEGRRMGFKELETLNALNLMKSQTIHLLYQRRDGLWAITGLVDDPDAPILHIPERYEKLDEEGRYFPFSVGANRTKS